MMTQLPPVWVVCDVTEPRLSISCQSSSFMSFWAESLLRDEDRDVTLYLKVDVLRNWIPSLPGFCRNNDGVSVCPVSHLLICFIVKLCSFMFIRRCLLHIFLPPIHRQDLSLYKTCHNYITGNKSCLNISPTLGITYSDLKVSEFEMDFRLIVIEDIGMSDERQNRPILSADKIARQKSVVSCKNRPILSAKIEHVLSWTILSADFLYIGQQILFMLPWWLFTMEDEYLF